MPDIYTENHQDDPADELPEYGDPGSVLFRWYWDTAVLRWCAEVYDYDSDSSLFWMEEGVGISYELEQQLRLDQEGWYVAANVTGAYFRGNWAWGEDDDEEWCIGLVRYATAEEIEAEALL